MKTITIQVPDDFKQRDEFLRYNEQLVKDYLMID